MSIRKIDLPSYNTIFSFSPSSNNNFDFIVIGKTSQEHIEYVKDKIPSTLEELRNVSNRLVLSKKEGNPFTLNQLRQICKNFGLTCQNKRYAIESLVKLIQ